MIRARIESTAEEMESGRMKAEGSRGHAQLSFFIRMLGQE